MSNDVSINETNEVDSIEELKATIKKLEEKLEEYKRKEEVFFKKEKEYEQARAEFEKKINELDEQKKALLSQSEKLEQAREQFKNLSRTVEQKKLELEKRERELFSRQEFLQAKEEEIKQEERKLEILKEEISTLEKRIRRKLSNKDMEKLAKLYAVHPESIEDGEIVPGVTEEKKGRAELLENKLRELLRKGNFDACYLIDEKGMIVAEYSLEKTDTTAICAMFSLITNSILKTINTLSLKKLEYFKLSTVAGNFLLKDLQISNYDRTLILLGHYVNEKKPEMEESLHISKKTLKKIIKTALNEYKLSTARKQFDPDVFDYLSRKLQEYRESLEMAMDIDSVRTEIFIKIALQIKKIFEDENRAIV